LARVELTRAASEDLERLVYTHSLPMDARERIARSVRLLEDFPRMGGELGGRLGGLRYLIGPWRWLVVVYEYFEDEDRVVVVSIQDGRSGRAPTPR
jgi:plasmid stabilization system protein ParE